nr:aldo/keto reductase [Dissulfurirhabdus thermomarina]
MGIRRLGRTGFRVSEIGFGAWGIGGAAAPGYGPTDDETSMAAVRLAVELGCTFFDTADSYGFGHSERLLGRALGAVRDGVFIATKAGYDFYHGPPRPNFAPAYLRWALEQSLRRLQAESVDLFQLHDPPAAVLFDPRVVAVLRALKAEGKARAVGVSAATVEDAFWALQAGWPETVQVHYHMLAPEAEALFPLAAARGVGIIAREPLANGVLTGKFGPRPRLAPGDIRARRGAAYWARATAAAARLARFCREGETPTQLALRFVLERPEVSVVVCGCKTPAQVRENLREVRRGATTSDG